MSASRTNREAPVGGKALQAAIIERARQLNWRVAHFPPVSTTRGGKTWWLTPVAADGKGFPDLLLVRERQVVAEVKGDGDRLQPDQQAWLAAFHLAGIEAYVWTPAAWRDGVVDAVLLRREPLRASLSVETAEMTHG